MSAEPAAEAGKARTLLVVLLGLPAAGKTTLAVELRKAAAAKGVVAHHICLDSLLEQQQQQQQVGEASNQPQAFSAAAWQACRQTMLQQVKQLLQLGQLPQQQQQQLIIVDDNNFYQSMRYQWLQLARSYGACFLQLYLDCSLELALQRNQKRHGSALVPDSVLARCAEAFELPDPSKRVWEAGRTWTLKASTAADTDCTWLWQQLQQHWGPPVPPLPDTAELEAVKAAATAANLASRVHQADLTSRAMLNAALEHVQQDLKPQVAKALNHARKEMLQHLRAKTAGTDSSGVVDEAVQGFHYMCMSQCNVPTCQERG